MTTADASLKIEVVSTGIKEASSALGGLSTSAKNTERNVTSLTTALEKLINVQASVTNRAAAQANAIGMNVDPTVALIAATERLSREMAQLGTAFQSTSTRARNSAAAIRFHTDAMQDAHAMARGLSGSLGALWVTYGNMIPLAAGLAIGGALKGIVSVGKDVESTLEGLRVKGNESVASVSAMRDAVIELGQGAQGPRDVAKAFETLILAGKNAQESMLGIKDALNLSLVGGVSVDKAAFTLVQVATSLGYTTEGFGRVADVIAKTAAASMSSVESLSEAFKSASSVGKLYGVTLVDIGTSLAALSNLGIQGSAAGTSLKNFYKELASNADKVKNTLAAMKLVPDDFKDAQGNFKSLTEVVGLLDQGLNKLTPSMQKVALANLSNERGMKTAVELIEMMREKTGDYGNALEKLRADIADSYGYAAIGAAQMAQTVENQFKSVKNTIETSFLDAFKSVEPQVLYVTTALKSAFKSDQFKLGIQSIATDFATVAMAIADNLPTIVKATELFIAFKVALAAVGIVTSIAEGVMTLSKALVALGVAANATKIALGAITIVLTLAAGAWAYYNQMKNENIEKGKDATAATSMKEFNNSLLEQIDRLKRVNDQLALGKTLQEANTEATLDAAMAQQQKNAQDRIAVAQAKVDQIQTQLGKVAPDSKWAGTYRARLEVAKAELKTVSDQVNSEMKEIENNIARLRGESRVNAAYQEQRIREAREKALAGAGTGEITKPNKAAENAAWMAVIIEKQGEINKAKREYAATEFELQMLEKGGFISKLEMIQREGTAHAAMYEKEIKSYKEIIALASTKAEKAALEAKFKNQLEAAQDNLAQNQVKTAQAAATEIAEIEKRTTQNKIEQLKARGELVAAAQVQNDETFAKEISAYEQEAERLKTAMDNAWHAEDVKEYARQLAIVEKYLASIRGKSSAFLAEAGIKQATTRFDELFTKLQADIESVNEKAVVDGGWIEKFASQAQIDKFVNDSLPALTKALEEAEKAANADGASPEARVAYEKKLRNYERYMKSQGKVYREFLKEIDQMGMEGFEALFSKVNGEWGDYVKKMKASLKKLLIDELYKFFAKPIVMNVVANVAGMFGMSGLAKAANAASGTGGAISTAANLAGAGSSLYNAYQAGGVAGVGNTMGQIGTYMTTQAAGGTAAVSTGSMGTGWVSAEGGAAYGAGATGATASGMGSVLSYLPYAAIAAAVIAVLANGFSMKKVGSGITGSVDSNGFDGNTYTYSKGGFLRGGGKTDTGVLDSATNTAFSQSVDAMQSTFKKLGTVTGAGTDVLKNFNYEFRLALADFDEEGKKKEIARFMSAMSDDMAMAFVDNFRTAVDLGVQEAHSYWTNTIDGERSFTTGRVVQNNRVSTQLDPFIDDMVRIFDKVRTELASVAGNEGKLADFTNKLFSLGVGLAQNAGYVKMFGEAIDFVKLENLAKTGETVVDTFNRLQTVFLATSNVAKFLGQNVNTAFGEIGLASTDARQALIELAGGVESLAKYNDYFINNILTEGEKMSVVQKDVEEAMTTLGFAGVTTKSAFANIVKGLNLSTKAGQELYVKLMALAPSFAELADYSTKTYDADLTSARNDLSEAYNTESKALQDLISKMGDSVKSLKKYKSDLLTGDLSPLTNGQKYATAAAKFYDVVARMNSGDKTAIDEFQDVSKEFLELSKIYNASGSQYISDFQRVMDETEKATKFAEVQKNIAQDSLDALNKQVSSLIDISNNTKNLNQTMLAVAQLLMQNGGTLADGGEGLISSWYKTYAGRNADASGMEYWKSILKANGVAYANQAFQNSVIAVNGGLFDGSHANGLDRVPFDGYRAILHRDETVLNANQAADYRSTQAALVATVEAMANEIRQLRAEQREQTGDLIRSNFEANEVAADKINDGTKEALSQSKYAGNGIELV